MRPHFCYTCVGLRENCPPGSTPGECAVAEAVADDYRATLAASGKPVYFASVPGGTTLNARQMDHTRKFGRDMDAYAEARKAGERPNQVSVAAVRQERQHQETIERIGKWL